jgi:hypothetical protein
LALRERLDRTGTSNLFIEHRKVQRALSPGILLGPRSRNVLTPPRGRPAGKDIPPKVLRPPRGRRSSGEGLLPLLIILPFPLLLLPDEGICAALLLLSLRAEILRAHERGELGCARGRLEGGEGGAGTRAPFVDFAAQRIGLGVGVLVRDRPEMISGGVRIQRGRDKWMGFEGNAYTPQLRCF